MITGTVVGGEEIAAKLREKPDQLRQALTTGVSRAVLIVQTRTKDKLSGEVLQVKTGRLRRSINQAVRQESDRVVGTVGTNVVYARPHEFGFQGVVTVKEHLRRTVSGKDVTVRSHSMQMNLPERSFLRTALQEMVPDIRAEFEAALKSAVSWT